MLWGREEEDVLDEGGTNNSKIKKKRKTGKVLCTDLVTTK